MDTKWNLVVIAAVGCGFAGGYITFDNSSELRDLRYRLAKAEDALARRSTEVRQAIATSQNDQAPTQVRELRDHSRASITDDDIIPK